MFTAAKQKVRVGSVLFWGIERPFWTVQLTVSCASEVVTHEPSHSIKKSHLGVKCTVSDPVISSENTWWGTVHVLDILGSATANSGMASWEAGGGQLCGRRLPRCRHSHVASELNYYRACPLFTSAVYQKATGYIPAAGKIKYGNNCQKKSE